MIDISIVVPVYNVERYLCKTVDSVLNQTYKNIQVILVDDGSPDSSSSICDNYSRLDDRVKVIHQKNGGVSSARAKGLMNADGDWVMYLDGDDWLPRDAIENLFYITRKHPGVDIVCGRIDVYNEREELVKSIVFDKILGYQDGQSYRSFLGRRPHGMHGVLYRKQILFTNSIVLERWITNNEDFVYNFLISARVKEMYCLSNVTCNHLRRDDGASRNKLDTEYWCKLLKYIRVNYKSYNVPDDEYYNYKLSLLNSLIRGKKYSFNYDDEEFSDIRGLNISWRRTKRENMLILALKYPSIMPLLLR